MKIWIWIAGKNVKVWNWGEECEGFGIVVKNVKDFDHGEECDGLGL